MNNIDSVLKITITLKDYSQHVFNERFGIISTFVPVQIRPLQRIVVSFLSVSNCLLDTYILTDKISAFIKEKKRQQAAHSSVSVVKRMNAQEVEKKARDQDQLIY